MKSIALACVLTFSAAVGSNAAGTFRAFGKWQVACDNVGHCAAFGISGEDVGEPRGGLRITRDAGYEGKITVRMDGVDAAEEETVYIDGKPHMNESRQSGGRGASENDPSLALIARMLDGRAFALKEPSQPQDQIALAGLKAALLYIDDKQGRVGARNAFVARGDKMVARKAAPYPVVRAARTVDRAGKAPDMSDAAGKKVMAHYRRHADRKICDIGMEPGEAGDKPGEWYGLGRTLMLAEVYCWRAAYQAGSVFYLYDLKTGMVRDAPFEQLDTKTGQLSVGPIETVTTADFANGALSSLHKGRGVGGCGERKGWQWDGAVFRLTDHGLKLHCGFSDAGFRLHGARVRLPGGTFQEMDSELVDGGY